MTTWSINDPVWITRGAERLEGVIAFTGTVSFASDDDWVGIRLTGPSAGQGKNDGSVKGTQYFKCPPGSGLFVRHSAVTERPLTRLEQLRLRRELGTSGGAAPAPAPSTAVAAGSNTSTRTTRTSRLTSLEPRAPLKVDTTPAPPGAEAPSSTKSTISIPTPTNISAVAEATSPTPPRPPRETVAPATNESKREEIRKRRLALQARKQQETGGSDAVKAVETKNSTPDLSLVSEPPKPVEEFSPATVSTAGPAPSSSSPILEEQRIMESSLHEWQEKFQVKESEALKLQEQLSATEQREHDARSKISQLELQLEKLRDEHAEALKAAKSDVPITMSSASNEADLEKVAEVERHNRELQDQCDDLEQQLTTVRRELDTEREHRTADQDALQHARTQASTVKQELQALMESTTQRGKQDSLHYKERAKLQSEVAASKRKVEQLENELNEMEHTLEELTLDKEQLQEEKEALEDLAEELKIDVESAQIQVDEIRMQLEDAQQLAAERTSQPGLTTEAIASMDAEDKVQALSLQNSRLREALLRLREQSSVEKLELGRQLREAEKQATAGRELVNEHESLQAIKVNLEEQVNDLKDMIEQSSAFESMVEDLSDRVLSLEEDIVVLQTTIREMEEAAELTAEMEEVQAEELKALAQDLEGRDTIIRNLEEAIKL